MNHADLVTETHLLLDLVAQQTTAMADNVMTIDVAEYTDAARFETERTALFRNYPQFVGPSCLLPRGGDYFAFDDTGIPILVVRNQEGVLKAFVNACSHRGAPLNESACGQARRGRMLTCPYHGWSYDLDGRLLGIPSQDAFAGVDRETLGLRELQVEEKHGFIFVMPNPELRFDIDEVLGGIESRLAEAGLSDHHHLGTKKVDTAFNWKLNMDTFQEFYHFESLHPETIGQMAYSNLGTFHQYGRNHAMGSATLNISELNAIPEAQWEPRKYTSFVNYIFPNTVIFVVEDHFQTWRVYPVSHDQSVVYHSMYLPQAPTRDAELVEREQYFQLINDVPVTEDYTLVDKIHRGLNSGLPRQVIIGRNEPGVQNMHRQIASLT